MEWVTGGNPYLDNCSFVDDDDCGDLGDIDMERQDNQGLERTIAQSVNTNVQSGNRTNLLFIDTCLDQASENRERVSRVGKKWADNPDVKRIIEYQNSILALKSGDFKALDKIVTQQSNSDRAYKDRLWAYFKSASVQIRLHDQLNEVIKLEEKGNDHLSVHEYNSMYTEIMDANDCRTIKDKLSKVAPENFTPSQG